MKKLFTILTTVLFCGALMVSCNKENKEDNTKLPTKADLVGTWEGSYSGTATLEEKQNVSYTIVWTLIMNPENAATFGSLSYKLNITGYEELVRTVGITGYGVRQNTDHGYVNIAAGGPQAGILDPSIDFSIDLKAKTLTGTFQAQTSQIIDLGGETTLHKK
ncbi:MAG: hypothetical protein IK126_05835 [Bacteroidales bacterium]|nr:hypothetical protein [Bacteroidales bacterium]